MFATTRKSCREELAEWANETQVAVHRMLRRHRNSKAVAWTMHALVTGGGGFLGGYIVKALLARGDRVRSFGRGDYPQLTAQGVEVVRGDIRDSAALAAACAGIECVFHTAAIAGIGMDRDIV